MWSSIWSSLERLERTLRLNCRRMLGSRLIAPYWGRGRLLSSYNVTGEASACGIVVRYALRLAGHPWWFIPRNETER